MRQGCEYSSQPRGEELTVLRRLHITEKLQSQLTTDSTAHKLLHMGYENSKLRPVTGSGCHVQSRVE